MKNFFMTYRVFVALFLGVTIGAFALLGFYHKGFQASTLAETFEKKRIPRGIWVTIFSPKKILYSKAAVAGLIDYCRKNRIDEIYLQIYRSGEAYYDSKIAGGSDYKEMVKSFGGDPIDYLVSEAQKKRIKVFAWVNVLSLAQNQNAPIVKKYDSEILTRDRSGRNSIKTDGVDHSDKFYLRDDQIFLEPGDDRVAEWTLNIVEEIATRYPNFNGIHLDYIRYPYPVPFIPDSRFVEFGVSYGYGKRNIERFKAATGLNPLKDDMYDNGLHLKWDNWKREQVTSLVAEAATVVRNKAKDWAISCAVVPTHERAYSIAYQDWPLWLERGIVDYVVLMDYTKDERLATEAVKGGLAYRGQGKVYAGLGVFLYKKAQDVIRLNNAVLKQNPDGVVFFSYDELLTLGVAFKE